MRISAHLVLMAAVPRLLTAQTAGQEAAWARADSVATIGNREVGLRTYAWRDFMPRPGGVPAGSDLMVNLQIQALDHRPLPPGLTVDSAWVRSAEGEWRTAPSPEPRPDLENGLDLVLRGGPRWSTNLVLDILVRLRLPKGEVGYAQTRDQPIGRAD